ncbi:MAG: hypothetical protein CEE42_07515 [Promethearchaeota archaeon Loki_b31]|nr:MAG: hypothetical protein CEE42_07480 [Candidatus Lokiarchaeota archaeon Loki_b31]TKJ25446.1 MAG: hypothetical protein CEE42_07515 [Candidatus Lokiarchaeota archaeon Loki_b31]
MEWAIKRVSKHEIARTTGVLYNTIVSVFKHEYGGMDSTRFEHLRDKMIGLRKKRFNLENIYKFHINKGKTFYPSNYRRDIKTWFGGMTPEEVEREWDPDNSDLDE